MDATIALSQIWGPIIAAIALGVLVSRSYYVKLYRDLEKETLAVLLFAMVAMGVGILQIMVHNAWDSFPQIVISLLGWGLVAKGALFAVAPRLVDRAGDWAVDSKVIPAIGSLMLILGGYLSWLGYFA